MINFILNGKDVTYKGDPQTSLLNYLREEALVLSPKNGCSPQATCGACTVEMDGRSTLSCVTPMEKLEGKKILTIEGFSKYLQDTLSHAFLEKGAIQCGYCIPGIISRTKTYLEKNSNPSNEEIIKALSPHLCRCTGYTKIVEAIEYAATAIREKREIPYPTSNGLIGSRHPKYMGKETALGNRLFVDDIRIPNMIFGALKFSDHPRAIVKKINILKAQQLVGVEKIFTSQDIPGDKVIGLIVNDWPLMIDVGETTHYVGSVIASVAATSMEIARQAISLIEVKYDVLDPVTDPISALKENAPNLHPSGNLLDTCIVQRGGNSKVAAANSEFVTTGHFRTQRIEHAYMETEVCVAQPDGDGIKVYSQSQGVYEDQRQICQLLNLPKEKVNVVLVPNGGGFGGKEDLMVQGYAALMAYSLDKTVKVALNRDESIMMSPKRHPLWMDYQVGCTRQGMLTFIKARMIGDTGAHASVGMKVMERAGGHSTGAYNIPVVDVIAQTVYTNNLPCGAMRGFGANQVTFALESCIDELCELGGFDRWQFRYDNALVAGSAIASGQKLIGGVGVRQTLEALKKEFYAAKYAGLACGIKNTGIGNGMPDASKVNIKIDSPTKIILYHGWTEMGQGVHNMAIQTFCQETKLSPDLLEIRVETKEATAFTGMTTASRATSLVGNAIINACKALKEDLKKNDLANLAGKEYPGEWICDFTNKPGKSKKGEEITHYSYSYATQLVVLDDQGKVDKIYAAHDAGKIMNPTLFEGQIQGSLHMGLGYALTEECPTKNAFPVSTKLKDLQILRSRETPQLIVKGIEVSDDYGPYGAKGVGEIGLVPTAPAVANALYIFDGKRRRSLPMQRKA